MTAKRRSVYLPEDQWERLREIAENEDRSVNYLVRQAISDFIAFGNHVPPSAGRPSQTTGESGVSSPAPAVAEDEAPASPSPENLVEANPDTLTGPAANIKSDDETRLPTDEEAALLADQFPHLREPMVVDPNVARREKQRVIDDALRRLGPTVTKPARKKR